jgi:hypothetical protein
MKRHFTGLIKAVVCFVLAAVIIVSCGDNKVVSSNPEPETDPVYFYYFQSDSIFVDILDKHVVVKFDTTEVTDYADYAYNDQMLVLRNDVFEGLGFVAFELEGPYTFESAAAILRARPEVIMVNPILPGGISLDWPIESESITVLLDDIIVLFDLNVVSRQQVDSLQAAFGLSLIEEHYSLIDSTSLRMLYRVDYPTEDNILDIANRVYETGLCKVSEPNFLYTWYPL